MSSRDTQALTDLEAGLPTTPEDVDVLRRLRSVAPADPFAAAQALHDALPATAGRRRRVTAAGRPDFEL